MSSFSVQALQEKLSRLTPSQDSIETLSLWIIHHQVYATTSVTVWLESVRNGKVESFVVPPILAFNSLFSPAVLHSVL